MHLDRYFSWIFCDLPGQELTVGRLVFGLNSHLARRWDRPVLVATLVETGPRGNHLKVCSVQYPHHRVHCRGNPGATGIHSFEQRHSAAGLRRVRFTIFPNPETEKPNPWQVAGGYRNESGRSPDPEFGCRLDRAPTHLIRQGEVITTA